MKQTTILIAALALLASCQSSQQMQGIFMGSSLGGLFGSSIGGLMEGPRGADAGRALGMLIGGATGAAVTSPKRTTEETTVSRHRDTDSYNRRSDTPTIPQEYDCLKIENLRYTDNNDNRTLDASERARLTFEIRNTGSTTVYNVAPVVNTSMTKQIVVSPPAIIASIAPGRSVRYTAELYGKKNLRTATAQFTISYATNGTLYTVRRFELATHGRK